MTGNRWFLRFGELSDAGISGLITSGFELLGCSYSLYQEVDERGRAQTGVRIDGLDIVYDGIPSEEIIRWAINSRKYYAGALLLLDANDMPQEKLFFEDGACVSMKISYLSDGNSYVSTALKVSPRLLKIDNDTLTQPWTFDDVTERLNRTKTAIGRIAQPIGKTDVYMVVNGVDYELSAFDMSCSQHTDYKGQPIEDIKGGMISFTIPQMPDAVLRKWMLGEDKLVSGEFQFRRGDQSMPLRVAFESAYCISMNPHKGSKGEMQTSFAISANELILNGTSLYNGWRV